DVTRMITAGVDKTAKLWELAKLPVGMTGGKDLDKPTATMTLPAAAESVSLSPNGQRVAVGVVVSGKEQVRLFDATTGKEMLELGEAEGMPGRSLTFLPDHRTLVAGLAGP